MQLCDRSVSLFNKAIENRVPVWRKTLLEGVSWYAHALSSVTDDGLRTANQFIIRIPFDDGYVAPEGYDGTEGTWTLRKGDCMVLGDVEWVATMAQAYGDTCMTITGVTDNRRAPKGKHFKVVGQ